MLVREEDGVWKEEVWSMEIAENVESDHHPLIISMKERMEEEGIRRKGKREKRMSRGVWNEERRDRFKEKLRVMKDTRWEREVKLDAGCSRIRETLTEVEEAMREWEGEKVRGW